MDVLGHRGSRVPGPENTPTAVDAALAVGADGIEVDVRRTADGELVCVHDARLPKLPKLADRGPGSPAVRQLTHRISSQAIAARASRDPAALSRTHQVDRCAPDPMGPPTSSDDRAAFGSLGSLGSLGGRAVVRSTASQLAARGIPTLADVMDAWAGRGRIILEIKNQPGQPDFDAPRERTARALVEFLRRRRPAGTAVGSLGAVTVSSFDWHAIEVMRDADIGVATAFLTMPRMSVGAGLTYVRLAGHTELHPHVSAVLGVAGAVERARRAGVRLVTWTVTSNTAALRLRDADVDGVICDDPAAVVRAVSAAGTPKPDSVDKP